MTFQENPAVFLFVFFGRCIFAKSQKTDDGVKDLKKRGPGGVWGGYIHTFSPVHRDHFGSIGLTGIKVQGFKGEICSGSKRHDP